jgi:hypothetical protein
MSVLDLPADVYHENDFDVRPALSSSIIKTLLERSPRHAWHQHPKLNPSWKPDDGDGKFDVGTVAHSIFLEGNENRVVVCDFGDWRKKEAQEARDRARDAGKIPLLTDQYDRVHELVLALGSTIGDFDADPPLFQNGRPERTITWEEDGVLCKARPDFLHDDLRTIDDLKTTGRLAAPERVSWLVFGGGFDVQAAFYLRGLGAVAPAARSREFRLVFVETERPYAVACYSLTPAALALANQKVDLALGIWKRCVESGAWPSYPRRVVHLEAPGWEENRVAEREYREEGVAA